VHPDFALEAEPRCVIAGGEKWSAGTERGERKVNLGKLKRQRARDERTAHTHIKEPRFENTDLMPQHKDGCIHRKSVPAAMFHGELKLGVSQGARQSLKA